MAAYVVALLTFPVDFGPRVGGVVLSIGRLVLLVALIVALFDWRAHRSAARRLPIALWAAWLAFLGSAFITAFTIPSSESWARYGSLVLEGVVVFLLVYRAALVPGGFRMLVVAVTATTVVIAVVALVVGAFGYHYDEILARIGWTMPVPEVSARFGLERQAGPFRGALYFGIWATAASALLLPALAEGTPRARRIAGAAWVVLLVAVVLLTTSRLAVTAMFVVPGVYFLARGRRRDGVACLFLAAAIGAVFSVLSLDPTIAGAGPGETGNVLLRSSTMRFASIQAAIEALRAHPLFGWGLLTDMKVLAALIGERNYVDNIYLSFLVEIGIVGTASFALLAAYIVVRSRRAWSSAVGLALGIAVVELLVMALFASTLKSTQEYAAFFVLSALVLAVATQRSDTRNDLVFVAQTPAPVPQGVSNVPGQRGHGEPEPLA